MSEYEIEPSDNQNGGVVASDVPARQRKIIHVFDGPAPEVESFATSVDEAEAIGAAVKAWLDDGIAAHEIGIFVRTTDLVDRARTARRG